MIKSETAKVYKGATRRWFTLQAAVNDIVRHEIRTQHCECDRLKVSYDEPRYICDLHRDPAAYEALAQTISRRVWDEHNRAAAHAPEVGA